MKYSFNNIDLAIRRKLSYLTYKVANKCLNVRERVEVVKRNKKDSPLPSPAVLLIISVRSSINHQ